MNQKWNTSWTNRKNASQLFLNDMFVDAICIIMYLYKIIGIYRQVTLSTFLYESGNVYAIWVTQHFILWKQLPICQQVFIKAFNYYRPHTPRHSCSGFTRAFPVISPTRLHSFCKLIWLILTLDCRFKSQTGLIRTSRVDRLCRFQKKKNQKYIWFIYFTHAEKIPYAERLSVYF